MLQINCAKCQIKFKTRDNRRKFCSRSCAASFNNTGRVRYKPKKKKCKYCDSLWLTTYDTRNNKHCSDCISNRIYSRAQSLNDIKGAGTRRRFLLRINEHICQICKRSEWNDKPIPLEIDHIDGNASNNVKDNLRIICPNCHAQTDTWKGKNKGKGRHKRTERYKLGKSY